MRDRLFNILPYINIEVDPKLNFNQLICRHTEHIERYYRLTPIQLAALETAILELINAKNPEEAVKNQLAEVLTKDEWKSLKSQLDYLSLLPLNEKYLTHINQLQELMITVESEFKSWYIDYLFIKTMMAPKDRKVLSNYYEQHPVLFAHITNVFNYLQKGNIQAVILAVTQLGEYFSLSENKELLKVTQALFKLFPSKLLNDEACILLGLIKETFIPVAALDNDAQSVRDTFDKGIDLFFNIFKPSDEKMKLAKDRVAIESTIKSFIIEDLIPNTPYRKQMANEIQNLICHAQKNLGGTDYDAANKVIKRYEKDMHRYFIAPKNEKLKVGHDILKNQNQDKSFQENLAVLKNHRGPDSYKIVRGLRIIGKFFCTIPLLLFNPFKWGEIFIDKATKKNSLFFEKKTKTESKIKQIDCVFNKVMKSK